MLYKLQSTIEINIGCVLWHAKCSKQNLFQIHILDMLPLVKKQGLPKALYIKFYLMTR